MTMNLIVRDANLPDGRVGIDIGIKGACGNSSWGAH